MLNFFDQSWKKVIVKTIIYHNPANIRINSVSDFFTPLGLYLSPVGLINIHCERK